MMSRNIVRSGIRLALALSLFPAAAFAKAPTPAAEPPYGTVVFLWGRLDKSLAEQAKWVEKEKERFAPIAQRLKRSGFGVRYVTIGTTEELRKAAQDPKTTVIIWSGGAAEEGMSNAEGQWQTEKKWEQGDLFDVDFNPIPYDIFDKTPGLRQIVLGSCYGSLAADRYAHTGARMLYFSDVITMTDLFDFLENGWADYLKKDFAVDLQPEKPSTKKKQGVKK